MRRSWTYEGQPYYRLDTGHDGCFGMSSNYRSFQMCASARYLSARSGRRDDVARSMCCGCWTGACREVGVDARSPPSLELRESCRNFRCLEHQTTTTPPRLAAILISPPPNAEKVLEDIRVPGNPSLLHCTAIVNDFRPHNSRLHHVQKQLRQRFGHLLASGPYLPG
jgi:hypothetical protein